MAQTVFINVTADKNAPKIADRTAHTHQAKRGAAAAADLTVSFDPAVLTTAHSVQSAMDAAMVALRGGKEVTGV
jgi:hypothetical protein